MKKTRLRNIIFLSKYLKSYSGILIKSIFVGFFYRLLPILVSFILSYIIGTYTSTGNTKNFPLYFGILFLLTILLGIGRYVDCIYSHDIAYRILAELRTKLYYKIEELSPAFLKKSRSGNILSIIMDDVNLLEWFYAHTFGILCITVLISAGILVFLCSLHYLLTLTILFWISFLVVIYLLFLKTSEHSGMEVRKNLGNLEAELADGIHGIKDIISLNFREGYKEKMNKAKTEYGRAYLKNKGEKGLQVALNAVVMNLASVSILIVTVYLIQKGHIPNQWYLVTVVVSSAIWSPITEFLAMVSQIGLISAASGRVLEILKEEPQVKDMGTKKLVLPEEYEISYENIHFAYPDEENPILSNISFSIYSGETIAISGVSGAGKSTIANLLLRFYDFQQGDIKINQQSIREFQLDSFRNEISVVPQNIYLFNTSILENVRISKPEATIKEITQALKLAGAEEFINDLPEGYDTVVGERGASLSGGQKQRIAIARAILKDSKILILDEASSNLDYTNEQHFNNSLAELKGDRTTIIIAHRLSMLKLADRIVFINKATVEDIGTYDELKERNIRFQEMIGELNDNET